MGSTFVPEKVAKMRDTEKNQIKMRGVELLVSE